MIIYSKVNELQKIFTEEIEAGRKFEIFTVEGTGEGEGPWEGIVKQVYGHWILFEDGNLLALDKVVSISVRGNEGK